MIDAMPGIGVIAKIATTVEVRVRVRLVMQTRVVMRVGHRDRIARMTVDDVRVGRSDRRSRLMGTSSMTRGSGIGVLRLRDWDRRRECFRNAWVMRVPELMVQHQQQSAGRGDHGKIERQAPIAMPFGIVARESAACWNPAGDFSPQGADRPRDTSARVDRGSGGRNAPPAMTADSGRVTGQFRHAGAAESASHVMQDPAGNLALAPGRDRVGLGQGAIVRTGRISRHVVGRGA
jgi:hypothetical protein